MELQRLQQIGTRSPKKSRNTGLLKSPMVYLSPIDKDSYDKETEIISSSYTEVFSSTHNDSSTFNANSQFQTRRTGRLNTSDYSSEDNDDKVTSSRYRKSDKNGETIKHVNLNEHPAYKLYKEAGEYWNKYPKTDYTYSRYSPHRREIAPGVIAMPNMSRRSIHRDEEQNSENHNYEKLFKSRIFSSSGERARRRLEQMWGRTNDRGYDETDLIVHEETFLQKFLRITRITLIYTTIINFISSYRSSMMQTPVNRRSHLNTAYSDKRWYQKIWIWIESGFGKVIATFYTLLGYVLLLDCWLLQREIAPRINKTSNRIQNVVQLNEQRWNTLKKVAIYLLIPLLLLLGVYYGINYDIKNNLPDLPEISIPEISLPPQLFEYAQSSQAVLLDTLEYTKLATNEYYNHLYKIVSDNIQYFKNNDTNT